MANTRSSRLSCIVGLIFCTSVIASSEHCGSEDIYAIKAVDTSDIVLDAADPTQVRIQRYTGSDTQLWKFHLSDRPGLYVITNKRDGKALDTAVGEDGHNHVVVNDPKPCMTQRWFLDYHGHITNAATGTNVDIHRVNYTPGNQIILWPNSGCICGEFLFEKKS